MRRRIDAQGKLYQLVINLVVVNGIVQIRQTRTEGYRLQPLRELTHFIRVIVFFDMLARPGKGHTVQQLEEIEIQSTEQSIR